MIISNTHNFIFIKPNKIAGTTIVNALVNAKCLTWEDVTNTPNGNNHQTYKEVESKLGSLKNYFVFSFVRNPYERILSFYLYLKEKEIPKKLNENRPLCENDEIARSSGSFKNAIKNGFMIPSFMSYFINKEGEINLDFIGKFENLQQDFNTVCDKIGIPRQQLPRKNKTNHKHYTEYYDDEAREIVAEQYEVDIYHFGYKFENKKWKTRHSIDCLQ